MTYSGKLEIARIGSESLWTTSARSIKPDYFYKVVFQCHMPLIFQGTIERLIGVQLIGIQLTGLQWFNCWPPSSVNLNFFPSGSSRPVWEAVSRTAFHSCFLGVCHSLGFISQGAQAEHQSIPEQGTGILIDTQNWHFWDLNISPCSPKHFFREISQQVEEAPGLTNQLLLIYFFV